MGLIVVTGAGGGLGRALACEFVARGHEVAGIGRGSEGLEGTAARAGAGFHPVLADVADPVAVRAAFARVDALGGLSVLVNNAAVYPRRDFLAETGESFMQTVAVNLGGTASCTIEALARFTTTGRGRIVNVATFADLAPIPASAGYAVSKGAARILSRALLADLADRFPRIEVIDWMPGMLATRMGIADGLDPAVAARWGVTLALWQGPGLSGTTWEMDREIPPPRSLRRRLVARLTGRHRAPRRLPV
ncbi:MAG: SDR family oxidoreductase [Rubellimicrobium sp.]|nr:SDR family oxidoreductase [Rubellimicrobium sp.]